jgi:rhodanese-related sulfurtransferase
MMESVLWDSPTLRKQLEENPDIRMIDVRSPAEYESAHIPGSYNVPMTAFEEHGPRIRDNVRDPVVFVCLSGMRAAKTRETATADPKTQELIDAGLTHIHVLEGGLKAWEAAGGRVTRGRQRWSTERQVRFITGSIVLQSVALSVLVPWLKWIAAISGGGLAIAALTNFCAMEMMLAAMPWNRSNRADIATVVDKLIAGTKVE